jgi:hypothetical protein
LTQSGHSIFTIAAVQLDSEPHFVDANGCCNRVLIGVVWFGNHLAARNARDAEGSLRASSIGEEPAQWPIPFFFAFMISDNPDSESAR